MRRTLLQLVSWVALFFTALPAILYLTGKIEMETLARIILIASLVWFAVTPLWMGRESGPGAKEDESVPAGR